MTLITWYLTKGCFYSDLAVVHVEGLTTPWPHLGVFLSIWDVSTCESSCLGVLLRKGWLFGCQLTPQSSSHSLWERICLPLIHCTRLPWAWPSSWVVSVPKASPGRQGYFASQAARHWLMAFSWSSSWIKVEQRGGSNGWGVQDPPKSGVDLVGAC